MQHADGAQGIRGRRRAFRSFFQALKTTDAVTGVIFFSSYFPVVAGGGGGSSHRICWIWVSRQLFLTKKEPKMQKRVQGNSESFKLNAIG